MRGFEDAVVDGRNGPVDPEEGVDGVHGPRDHDRQVPAGLDPAVRVPKWVAGLLAGEMAVIMMTEGRGFCNATAKRELGWKLRYPSWRQGFKEELA